MKQEVSACCSQTKWQTRSRHLTKLRGAGPLFCRGHGTSWKGWRGEAGCLPARQSQWHCILDFTEGLRSGSESYGVASPSVQKHQHWDTTKQRHETGLSLMLACRHQARGSTGPPCFTAASQRGHCMWEAAERSLLLTPATPRPVPAEGLPTGSPSPVAVAPPSPSRFVTYLATGAIQALQL